MTFSKARNIGGGVGLQMEIQGAKHMISIKNKDFHVTQDQK